MLSSYSLFDYDSFAKPPPRVVKHNILDAYFADKGEYRRPTLDGAKKMGEFLNQHYVNDTGADVSPVRHLPAALLKVEVPATLDPTTGEEEAAEGESGEGESGGEGEGESGGGGESEGESWGEREGKSGGESEGEAEAEVADDAERAGQTVITTEDAIGDAEYDTIDEAGITAKGGKQAVIARAIKGLPGFADIDVTTSKKGTTTAVNIWVKDAADKRALMGHIKEMMLYERGAPGYNPQLASYKLLKSLSSGSRIRIYPHTPKLEPLSLRKPPAAASPPAAESPAAARTAAARAIAEELEEAGEFTILPGGRRGKGRGRPAAASVGGAQ